MRIPTAGLGRVVGVVLMVRSMVSHEIPQGLAAPMRLLQLNRRIRQSEGTKPEHRTSFCGLRSGMESPVKMILVC